MLVIFVIYLYIDVLSHLKVVERSQAIKACLDLFYVLVIYILFQNSFPYCLSVLNSTRSNYGSW